MTRPNKTLAVNSKSLSFVIICLLISSLSACKTLNQISQPANNSNAANVDTPSTSNKTRSTHNKTKSTSSPSPLAGKVTYSLNELKLDIRNTGIKKILSNLNTFGIKYSTDVPRMNEETKSFIKSDLADRRLLRTSKTSAIQHYDLNIRIQSTSIDDDTVHMEVAVLDPDNSEQIYFKDYTGKGDQNDQNVFQSSIRDAIDSFTLDKDLLNAINLSKTSLATNRKSTPETKKTANAKKVVSPPKAMPKSLSKKKTTIVAKKNSHSKKKSSSLHDAPKHALVIGNGNYDDAPLSNPTNDATDMARILKRLGFNVTKVINGSRRDMRIAFRKFGDNIRYGGVGLFYYAGHGAQVNGVNYLIPVDADIEHEDEVIDEAINASAVLRKMETAGNRLNIAILDACRNNPYKKGSRSGVRGLARMSSPLGSLVAYSTAPGSVAADGSGRNGTYTKHLLKAMQTPGLTLEQVFKTVRVKVQKSTAGAQIPWESSSLTDDFYFIPDE